VTQLARIRFKKGYGRESRPIFRLGPIQLGVGGVIVGAAALAGTAYLFRDQLYGFFSPLWAKLKGARVSGRAYAAGVHPALPALLDLWDQFGWFDVTVAPPFKMLSGDYIDGGLRTDEAVQGEAQAEGLSKAGDLYSTPHGRGAALDIYPVGFDPHRSFEDQPEMAGLMAQFASWASQQTVVLGQGTPTQQSFTFYPGINFGDYPHIEIKGWQSLPYPPPSYAT
jgi:hypothetical protein